jgi:trehalose utilization protein
MKENIKEVQLVITNAVRWAAPVEVHGYREMLQAPHVPEPMEKLEIAD